MLEESAVSRALFCQEIIDSIFSHLSLNSVFSRYDQADHLRREYINEAEQRKRRGTLASAARVSKHISEAALSVLWARLDSFPRLFRIWPQYSPRWDAYEELVGEPTEADWIRLEKYAILVREAHCFYPQRNEQQVWKIILKRYGTVSRFLPRLTSLETLHITPADTSFDLPLLLPTLQHLSIRLDNPPQPSSDGVLMTTALERITAEIPGLSSLRIAYDPQGPTPISVDTTVLSTVGQFHDLRSLSVYIRDGCSCLQGCLQALTELNIGGCTSHIQSFLAATSPPLLETLSMTFLHDPSTDVLMQCMSFFPTAIPTTLSALTLASELAFSPPLASVLDLVQPALAFRALSAFTLKLRPLPSISDAAILTMLAAWPALTTLRIPHDHVVRPPAPLSTRPTALLFPSIAARCPHLDTLELPEVDLAATPAVDALSLLPPPPSHLSLSRGHGLRALDMAREFDFSTNRTNRNIHNRSGLSGAERHVCLRAAVMLDRLFPRMELPGLRGGMGDEGEEKGWAGVVRLLHAMQAGRAHGEAFSRAEAGCGADRGGDGSDGSESESEGSDEDGEEDEDEEEEDDENKDEDEEMALE